MQNNSESIDTIQSTLSRAERKVITIGFISILAISVVI